MSAGQEGAGKPLAKAIRDFLAANGRKGAEARKSVLSPARRLEISILANAAKSAKIEAKKKREKRP